MARDLKPVYAARDRSCRQGTVRRVRRRVGPAVSGDHPAMGERSARVPFLDYDTEIRRVICSTNAIESVNDRYRRAIRARGTLLTEQSVLKWRPRGARPGATIGAETITVGTRCPV
ncbi:transposase [Gordonia sp. NPDC003504]